MNKLLLLGLLVILGMGCEEKPQEKPMYTLFVGTYTNGDSEGIYTFQFDADSGVLSNKSLAAELTNPSFLAISENKEHLYAVQETADFDSLGGGVTAFKLKDGVLELQNSKGTGGANPCHISLSGDGFLSVANYSGGNVALFNLNDDGSLGDNRQIIDHKVLDTTKTAHAHMTKFMKDGLFATDLGLDALKRYVKQSNEWIPAHQASIDFPEGAGPRHFVFSESKAFLYVINEINSTLTVLQRDDEGSYNAIQTEKTLDSDYEGKNACADIHLSPDGKFLYGTNRGENTVVIFGVDSTSGKLNLVGRESVHGNWPRNFTLDPSGNFLLVANQLSNNISIFKRDVDMGTLTFLNEIEMPSPVCLKFLD